MANLSFLAHSEHKHSSEPWWTNEITVDIVIVLGFLGLLLLTTRLKAKPATRLIIAMVYLLLTGFLAYRISPAISITSITLGMGIALTTTFLQLGRKH